MYKNSKTVIAINQDESERKIFPGISACAKALGVSNAAVAIAIARGGSVKGWKLYDSPEMIRKRIVKLQQQMEYLEGLTI